MLRITENGTAAANASDVDASELEATNGAGRIGLEFNGKPLARKQIGFRLPSALSGYETPQAARPVLAVFCYEDRDSEIGQFAAQTALALARRQIVVHLFSRRDFELDATGVFCNGLGDCEDGDLTAQVHEFASRACNAFLKTFPAGSGPVTLLGHEWSSIPTLLLLRGIKRLDALLSLHSLERQRSDMTDEISTHIEEIELSGLRAATTTLFHDPAALEMAKERVAECAPRFIPAYQRFPAHLFENELDAGAVKARFQVGPVDPTILFVGDLDERYGPDLLVKALPGVLKNHPQTRLIVVGDGPLYWPLRVYTRYLLLEHAVRLVGSIEGQSLHELVQAADIVAVPSRDATPWWHVQAAWAARRPVVATHPSALGLLEHEKDAVLVYPSENSLVWGIERILYDAELAKAMGDRGREKLEERFGWNSAAAQLEQLLVAAPAR